MRLVDGFRPRLRCLLDRCGGNGGLRPVRKLLARDNTGGGGADGIRAALWQGLGRRGGKGLRRSADPRCLAEKKLDESQLEAKARELLLRYGTRMSEAYLGLVDLKKLEAALEARVGSGVKGEIARLRSAPEVAEFEKI